MAQTDAQRIRHILEAIETIEDDPALSEGPSQSPGQEP